MDSRKDQVRQTVFASVGIAIIMVAVYTDIKAELSFTENSRNGVYAKASQAALTPVYKE